MVAACICAVVVVVLYAAGVDIRNFLNGGVPEGVSENVRPLDGSSVINFGVAEFNGVNSKYMRCKIAIPHSDVIERYAESLKGDNILTRSLNSPELSESQKARAAKILAEGRDFVRVFTPQYSMLGYRDLQGQYVSIVAFAGSDSNCVYILSRTLESEEQHFLGNATGVEFMDTRLGIPSGLELKSAFKTIEGEPMAMFLLEGNGDRFELIKFYKRSLESAGWSSNEENSSEISAASGRGFLSYGKDGRSCFLSIQVYGDIGDESQHPSIITINFR